jgi:hypothetical protein
VLPLVVSGGGFRFELYTTAYLKRLAQTFDAKERAVFRKHAVSFDEAADAIARLLKVIALPLSPHASVEVLYGQVRALIDALRPTASADVELASWPPWREGRARKPAPHGAAPAARSSGSAWGLRDEDEEASTAFLPPQLRLEYQPVAHVAQRPHGHGHSHGPTHGAHSEDVARRKHFAHLARVLVTARSTTADDLVAQSRARLPPLEPAAEARAADEQRPADDEIEQILAHFARQSLALGSAVVAHSQPDRRAAMSARFARATGRRGPGGGRGAGAPSASGRGGSGARGAVVEDSSGLSRT